MVFFLVAAAYLTGFLVGWVLQFVRVRKAIARRLEAIRVQSIGL